MQRSGLIFLGLLFCFTLCAQTQEVSLRECLDLSESNDPYLQNSLLEIKAAHEQRREAMWEYYPKLSINGLGYYAAQPLFRMTLSDVLGNSDMANIIKNDVSTFARENGMKDYYASFQRGFSLMASAIQPIYAGGRIVSGNKLAELGVEASRLQSSIKRKETAESVEQKYWLVVSLQEKRKTLNVAMEMLDTLYRDVSAAYHSGLVLRSDLDKVSLKIKELKSADVHLKSGTKLAKMDLFNAIGMKYSTLGLDSYHFSERLDSLPAPYLVVMDEGDIDVFDESRLLELKVEAEKLEKKMSVGEYLPQLAAGFSYGYSNLQGRSSSTGNFNGIGMLTLQVPLTDIGKAVRRSRRYDYKIQEARNEQVYLDSQLLLQLRMLQVEMETAWDQLKLSEQYQEDALNNFRMTQADFKAGRVPVSDLLQSRLDCQTASEEVITRQMEYKMETV